MHPKGKVLLVEDNKELNDNNARALKMLGYDVYQALTLAAAREYLSGNEPDIILMDVMLPDGDGMDFCGEIRSSTRAHILFLTAKTEQADILRGLALGGDDYITKPFHPKELLARAEAVMRRRNMTDTPTQIIKKGALTLDVVAAQAFVEDTDLLLQPREFALLLLLAQNEGEIMDAETLYEKAWGRPLAGDRNTLQVTVSKIRKKLEHAGYDISVARGKGYFFMKN